MYDFIHFLGFVLVASAVMTLTMHFQFLYTETESCLELPSSVTLVDVSNDITLTAVLSVVVVLGFIVLLCSLGSVVANCVMTSSLAGASPVVTSSTTPVPSSAVDHFDVVAVASLPAAT